MGNGTIQTDSNMPIQETEEWRIHLFRWCIWELVFLSKLLDELLTSRTSGLTTKKFGKLSSFSIFAREKERPLVLLLIQVDWDHNGRSVGGKLQSAIRQQRHRMDQGIIIALRIYCSEQAMKSGRPRKHSALCNHKKVR